MAGECEPNHELHEEKPDTCLIEVMKNLEGWRAALIRINSILQWEKPYHPVLLLAPTTLIFLLIWCFEPSLLTAVALLGMSFSLIDFLVPLLSSFYAPETWTGIEEQQFEQICERIMHVKDHFVNARDVMISLKDEKPKVFFAVTMGLMSFLAWLGSLINNLVLTYLLANFLLILPGLRRHQIIERYFRGTWLVLKRLILGKQKAKKT